MNSILFYYMLLWLQVFPVYTMKVHKGSRFRAPPILNHISITFIYSCAASDTFRRNRI